MKIIEITEKNYNDFFGFDYDFEKCGFEIANEGNIIDDLFPTVSFSW